MTEFNRTESAKWALETQKVVGELQTGADKALSEAAGRGFPAAPGVTLAVILAASQEAKGKLTEANGKIYEDRRGVIFQVQEFFMKSVVQAAKLGMELYRAELLNALEIEQAENIALRDQGLADVIRQTSEVEGRQAAIIMGRAEAERQVIWYKVALAEAERNTNELELSLTQAQLVTATKKLEIIESIYRVLAAEELVLAAEQARARAEEEVLTAKRELAAVKMGMVPLYIEKADAKVALAEAITAEVPDQIALVNLGYDRADLKVATGLVEHGIRDAELNLEMANVAATRASVAVELARSAAQVKIAEASNYAQEMINGHRYAAGELHIKTRAADRISRANAEGNYVGIIANAEMMAIASELSTILANITARAKDEVNKLGESLNRYSESSQTHLIGRRIIEGVF
jgi:hypothetical protein